MKKIFWVILVLSQLNVSAQHEADNLGGEGKLLYHTIKTDKQGKIIPWYSDDPSKAYDFVINAVWTFWDTMRKDMNGIPYYMNHQVWKEKVNDNRGIGGDQLQMALSSWNLLYNYSGDLRVLENMKFMADYYLTHSLSSPTALWPNIPYPYNTLIYSGFYDGDMVIGKGYTQPDKAGSFGIELVNLYKMTGNENYLNAAINIANTLSSKIKEGDNNNSPLPFKVHAETGEIGYLKNKEIPDGTEPKSSYVANFAPTLMLFSELTKMNKGNTSSYKKGFDVILNWMKEYPMKTNKWGPFFEDIWGWSDSQINAVTFAHYILENPSLFPNWKKDVRSILDWTWSTLGNDEFKKYGGLKVMNEQTAFKVPGNSHTARQSAIELLYAAKTGDTSRVDNAIRGLNWATYMVNPEGRNCYPQDDIWLTDGYGDYVRHYLRSMAAMPKLAPSQENHLLKTSTSVKNIVYKPEQIKYLTFDKESNETFRLSKKPKKIIMWDKKELQEKKDLKDFGWNWTPMENGGLLNIKKNEQEVKIILK